MVTYSRWLELFIEHGQKCSVSVQMSLLCVIGAHRGGDKLLLVNPNKVAENEGMTLNQFTNGLYEAKKQGWLGEVRKAFNDRAILITLTIPKGLSESVASSD